MNSLGACSLLVACNGKMQSGRSLSPGLKKGFRVFSGFRVLGFRVFSGFKVLGFRVLRGFRVLGF